MESATLVKATTPTVQESKQLIDAATRLPPSLTSPDEEAATIELLAAVKKEIKKVKATKDLFAKPLRDQVAAINAMFAPYLDRLDEIAVRADNLVIAWRKTEMMRQAKQEREQIEKDAKQAVRAGDVSSLQSLQQEHQAVSEVAPKKIETNYGNAHFRKYWKYEIVKESLIPDEFWMVDEKKIKAAIETGAIVPGVRSWQDDKPIVRT